MDIKNILIILFSMGIIGCNVNNKGMDNSESAPTSTIHRKEEFRPQLHYSPDSMWMNDPNGLVFLDGEYHLFYQYYPDSTVWGPMHWGHAISDDLVHWKPMPIALFPDSLGYIFSGSAVVDWNNTSGLGEGLSPPLIAIFTHHNMEGERAKRTDFQYQSIAYSNDKGRTWKKYDANPVVSNPGLKDFRDPKVIWDEERNQWVMVVAAYDKALFYTSKNLIDWQSSGSFGIPGDTRLWECPDLFPLKVEETGEVKWILIVSIQQQGPNGGSATSYFVGDFDGEQFIGENAQQKWLDYGTDNYAFVTWSDIPEDDGRRIGIGWMSNWQYAQVVPTDKWRSAITLPRTLTLHAFDTEYELRSLPVHELGSVSLDADDLKPGILNATTQILNDNEAGLCHVELVFEKPDRADLQLLFENKEGDQLRLGYLNDDQSYFIDRTLSGAASFYKSFGALHKAPIGYKTETIKFSLWLDHSSIELFADDGRLVMTDIVFPKSPFSQLSIIVENQPIHLLEGKITRLKSIWEN